MKRTPLQQTFIDMGKVLAFTLLMLFITVVPTFSLQLVIKNPTTLIVTRVVYLITIWLIWMFIQFYRMNKERMK